MERVLQMLIILHCPSSALLFGARKAPGTSAFWVCLNAFLGQSLKHMLKYFAALGSWAGNEDSVEKLLTLVFCMNSETHKGVYYLYRSSLFLMKHRTEVFSGIRGFAGQLETWEIVQPVWETRGSFKVISPWLRVFGGDWLSSSVLASCPGADPAFFKDTSHCGATSAVPWTFHLQGEKFL